VSVGFGYFSIRDVRLADTWTALGASNYWWLVPGTATLAIAIALRAIRWRALFDPASRPPLAATARALLVGYLFNNILPLRAGEAIRVVALKRFVATASRAETASTVVVERVYDVASLLALLFVALIWLPELSWMSTAIAFGAAIAALLVAAVIVLTRWRAQVVRLGLRAVGFVPVGARDRSERAVLNVVQGFAGLTRTRVAGAALAWTVASWLVMAVSFWFVMRCFDFGLSPAAGLLVAIATSLSLILPSSPGSLGVFEAAVLIALDAYDVPRAEALSYALVLHAVNFFPFVIAGALAFWPQLLPLRRRASPVAKA
jgi:glycosyltransferase 2 family protein